MTSFLSPAGFRRVTTLKLGDCGGANNEQPAAAFGPKLAENQTDFDDLAQTNFVAEEDAFAEGRFQGELGGVNLLPVQVNAGVAKGGGEPVNVRSCAK